MIKLIALISMFIDHVGQVYYPDVLILHLVGRFAFPLFAYSVARAIKTTKDITRYKLNLFILAAVSQVPYYLMFGILRLNVVFLFLISVIIIEILNEKKFLIFTMFLVTIILIDGYIEYGLYGLLMVMVFFNMDKKKMLLSIIILQSIAPITQAITILSVPLVKLLEGCKWRIRKEVFYIAYPGHLILLIMIKYIFV